MTVHLGKKKTQLFIYSRATIYFVIFKCQTPTYLFQPTFLLTKQVKWQTKCIQIKIKIQMLHSTPPM